MVFFLWVYFSPLTGYFMAKPPSKKTGSAKIFTPVDEESPHFFRAWMVPIGLTAGIAIFFYLALRSVDFSLSDGKISFINLLFLTDPQEVGNNLGGVSEVLIAILGLVITVAAIVVQLAAQRYTPKLVDLFIADPVNIAYFVLMVVASMYSMLLIYSTTPAFLPFWGAVFLVVMTMLILALLVPYFSYMFMFLTPGNIIKIIRRNARKGMYKVLEKHNRPGEIRKDQKGVANSMEQISDIALSAVSQMDRNVALMSIRALKDVMVDHLLIKRRMPKEWFYTYKDQFPALSSDFIQEINRTRTWIEVKGFMDMELIFKTALKEMPDAVSAVANNAKIVGMYALKLKDLAVFNDVVQFFNTFLRLSVNDRNPKAIYNLFLQYRLLAEEVLVTDPIVVEKITFYFKYYGQIAQTYNIPLILITACFDLAHLLERAYLLKVPNMDKLVDTFLEVDDNPATKANEFELRSVRKAQLMFASFLLGHGDKVWVEKIFLDIIAEPQDRLEAIRAEMMAVKDRKFWEVTDRGVDFFYMDEEQKGNLNEFFETWVLPHFKSQSSA